MEDAKFIDLLEQLYDNNKRSDFKEFQILSRVYFSLLLYVKSNKDKKLFELCEKEFNDAIENLKFLEEGEYINECDKLMILYNVILLEDGSNISNYINKLEEQQKQNYNRSIKEFQKFFDKIDKEIREL